MGSTKLLKLPICKCGWIKAGVRTNTVRILLHEKMRFSLVDVVLLLLLLFCSIVYYYAYGEERTNN